jgi:hypothetical protein
MRHQRDLFSGGPTLGIPDVNTHVGSVIHAFENLAYHRQMKEGERPYESSKSSSSKKDSIYKIILPPPPKTSTTATITDPPRQIVRSRPKGRAPDVPTSASATTQTTKFSGDENESSAVDSLNLEDDYRRNNKFPQSYIRNYKVMPPFAPPPPRQPSRIPTKAINKSSNQLASRNRMSDSLLLSKARADVFLKPNKYTEDDIEKDFLRGTTVSQSFIKNVMLEKPKSTYEQNFLMNDESDGGKSKRRIFERSLKTRSANFEPLIDEVKVRYTQYNSNKKNPKTSRQQNFRPRSTDRAEL